MPKEFTELGVREVWNQRHAIVLSPVERARHLYLIGMTGTGKSTLIANLVRQDIEAGLGVTLIDPHGDLAESIYDFVPSCRIDDVVIVDPTDIEHVPGLNPFYRVAAEDRPTIASNLVEAFRHVWSDSWGPRLEHILFNATRLLLDSPDHLRPTIISIARILVEKSYREQALRHSTDPAVERFFKTEFDAWNPRFLTEALAPVQNKLGAVLANPNVRNILGQWQPSVNLADVIDRERILIVRVPKGTLGETQASLVGAMVVSGLMHAAMAQRSRRTPHALYIDEFQNFTTDSFTSILAEARKFKLSLTVGHQFVGQLPDQIREAVFGNVGTIVSFRVGAEDAERLAHECRDFAASRFQDLKLGQIIVKTMGHGGMPVSFLGATMPSRPGVGTSRRVIDKSRRAFGRPRNSVEKRIGLWLRG